MQRGRRGRESGSRHEVSPDIESSEHARCSRAAGLMLALRLGHKACGPTQPERTRRGYTELARARATICRDLWVVEAITTAPMRTEDARHSDSNQRGASSDRRSLSASARRGAWATRRMAMQQDGRRETHGTGMAATAMRLARWSRPTCPIGDAGDSLLAIEGGTVGGIESRTCSPRCDRSCSESAEEHHLDPEHLWSGSTQPATAFALHARALGALSALPSSRALDP
jgi:hypothetical protein